MKVDERKNGGFLSVHSWKSCCTDQVYSDGEADCFINADLNKVNFAPKGKERMFQEQFVQCSCLTSLNIDFSELSNARGKEKLTFLHKVMAWTSLLTCMNIDAMSYLVQN